MVSVEEGNVVYRITEVVRFERGLKLMLDYVMTGYTWNLITVVSRALRYSAGSFCFMIVGTKRTALMNGISSLTAQLHPLH